MLTSPCASLSHMPAARTDPGTVPRSPDPTGWTAWRACPASSPVDHQDPPGLVLATAGRRQPLQPNPRLDLRPSAVFQDAIAQIFTRYFWVDLIILFQGGSAQASEGCCQGLPITQPPHTLAEWKQVQELNLEARPEPQSTGRPPYARQTPLRRCAANLVWTRPTTDPATETPRCRARHGVLSQPQFRPKKP